MLINLFKILQYLLIFFLFDLISYLLRTMILMLFYLALVFTVIILHSYVDFIIFILFL